MKSGTLSIIVPVFNEEKTIQKLVDKILKVKIGSFDREIIIINDASNDSTKDKLAKFKRHKRIKVIHHSVNQGKGAAIKTGIKKATGLFLIIQDADFEYNPSDIKTLLKVIHANKKSVVYGSRYLGKHFDTFTHKLGNKAVTLTTNLLYGCSLTDMETCYKLIPRQLYKQVDIQSKRFNFEPEITAKIIRKGYKIIEVPISYHKRNFFEGKKLRWWKDGFSAIWTLFKYRFVSIT